MQKRRSHSTPIIARHLQKLNLLLKFSASLLVVGGLTSFSIATAADFKLPEQNLSVSDRLLLLAIDDQSLQPSDDVQLKLNKPQVRKQPVLAPESGDVSAPDSMASHFYGSVVHHEGKYQMWYYSVSLKRESDKLKQGPVCYAESDDGIHWTKPKLGQVEIAGSKQNNALLLPEEITQCAAVILDEADPDPNRRYKMVYTALTHTWVFRPATSPDGIHWTASEDYPVDQFLEMGSLLKFGDQFVAHGQGIGKDANGNPEGRQGYASTSTNFSDWNKQYVSTFRLPEPDDIKLRGLVGDYPQVHLGIGASSFGNVAVGLYGIWHNPPIDKRRKKGWYGAGLITCDLGLVVSNDGVQFREPIKDNIYISSEESPVTPVPGIIDPTILCQANGILNVGDQTLIYHGRWRNATITGKDYYAEVALATLPRDRWGSLQLTEEATSGSILSQPITLPAGECDIQLNADEVEHITIEVADASGDLIPEFSGENSGTIDATEKHTASVNWPAGSLFQLEGKTVQLRIGLTNKASKLYAVYLNAP
ncbi:hypothetical protein Pla110_40850 [Polystyrenella longa]|uniref:Glycosyl hydrolase family 32 N-terminal domain-containing protein n=1 Tax=Polystyrenella longa TaxID=2528007 RepID=A0A518CSX6_9PLAN|nr:hypothetical protein [Polystyrenella longa]QDU82330.1 hypothetical protein Pla110_40850 [Polystyrenella longa]